MALVGAIQRIVQLVTRLTPPDTYLVFVRLGGFDRVAPVFVTGSAYPPSDQFVRITNRRCQTLGNIQIAALAGDHIGRVHDPTMPRDTDTDTDTGVDVTVSENLLTWKANHR